MQNTSQAIAGILDALLAASTIENIAAYQTVAKDFPVLGNAAQLARRGDAAAFTRALAPLEHAVDGLLESALPGKREAQFMLKQHRILSHHFCRVITEREGLAFSADKTRCVLRRLLAFFITGEEIVFDYTAQYTYHLPREVFTSHAEIVTFFDALQCLFYGNAAKYLAALQQIQLRVEASTAQ